MDNNEEIAFTPETRTVKRVCSNSKIRQMNRYSNMFWTNVERIVESRKEITWAEISRYLGTDRTTIATMRTRRSRVSLDTILNVAEYLGVPAEQLIKDNDSTPHEMERISLSEDEYQLLMEYRAVRNRKRDDAARKILFTVLRELKNIP